MIHQYQLGGYNIVLDVCSGSVHAVDKIAYEIIRKFEKMDRESLLKAMEERYAEKEGVTREELEDCYSQVANLRDEGKLFAPEIFEPMAGFLKEKTSGVVKALCIHIGQFGRPPESGGGFFWRGAFDELSGGEGNGGLRPEH